LTKLPASQTTRRLPVAPAEGPPTFAIERAARKRGLWPIAGVDEAGRGPLAGPVAVAAVVLDPSRIPKGLNDSKLLSPQRREELYEVILARSLAVSIAFASAGCIDSSDIRRATLAAMRRAVFGLALAPAYVIVDGRDVPDGLACSADSVVKGDARSQSIAAASIVAKVTRDRLMQRLARAYPAYGFEAHKGYGTAFHAARIALHGPSPYHRMTFAPFAGDGCDAEI
jgi:ribonuclease HII